MCDVEEPPAKISKLEMNSHEAVVEEGQEEWLSEDMLTDDDNHPDEDPDKTDSNLDTSQEELDETFLDEDMLSAEHSLDSQNMAQTSQADITQEQDVTQEQDTSQENIEAQDIEHKEPKETIEQTLNDFENESQETTDKQTDNQAGKSDGNDTDDLLRLLGDNDDKSKKKVLVKTKEKNGISRGLKEKPQRDDDSGSSDDDYIFNNSTVQKLRMAKSVLARKPAAKAEPEDFDEGDDDTDCTSDEDETSTMQNIFAMNKKKNAVKNTTKSSQLNQRPPVKKILKIGDTTIEPAKKITPNRVANKSHSSKPVVSTVTRTTHNGPVSTITKLGSRIVTKEKIETKPPRAEHDEIIDEEEFMEEDDFDLDDDFSDDVDLEDRRNTQRLMKPEEMDEEVPSDIDSLSDSDAVDDLDDIFDEVPSPELEDREDWFSLDIRAERAGEYLPLLGNKAHELLTAEKKRVSSRLSQLRAQLSQLQCSGQQQARLLRRAAIQQAEIDDMIKAV